MSTQLDTMATTSLATARAGKSVKTRKKSYLLFFTSWLLLIATGILGAVWYTEHIKQQITSDLYSQTNQQLQTLQSEYQQQVDTLKASMTSEMSKLQAKVDSFNELLAFSRDSANSKTDNSNQLYTQLQEVKKKLDDLKKNLDVLQ
jgi:DNA repair exonuclease SbcCD ATPase subunit